MDNVALYTKYRPSNFDEIKGQDAIVQTLRNQIKSQRIGHSYLFFGLRGSGKTSIARIFARAINCESPVDGNPCGSCNTCHLNDTVNPDIIEIDAASNNNIDNIRRLVDEMKYRPIASKYKVYIIDETHMLSNNSFNVLLKSIEEPPEYTIFILCTTELQKIPDTIKSRCQIYNFKYIAKDNIESVISDIMIKENMEILNVPDIVSYIAEKAEGSLRDAVSIVDQCISYFANSDSASVDDIRDMFGDVTSDIINDLVSSVKDKNISKGLEILQKQYYNGMDLKNLIKSLYNHYFNAFAFEPDNNILNERYITILGELLGKLERSTNVLPLCEVSFIKMCKPQMERDYNSLVQRISELENKLSNVNISNKETPSIDVSTMIPIRKVNNIHQIILKGE